MSDSLRYKIVLWMVWVQITLLPVIIVMITVTNNYVMWRWNLLNNFMVIGYVLGLLALPASRGLEKPKLLKWWLRVDFWGSLIPSFIVLPLLFSVGRHYIDAEDGDYVLYRTKGLMAAAPHFWLGKKDGIFIRELPQAMRLYDYGKVKIDCFRVDTLKGCCYGLNRGSWPSAWVCPIDSMRYHRFAVDITYLIDSLYQTQPLFRPYYYGTFVYPDNFAEINYYGEQICYEDSMRYDIDFLGGDSLSVTIFNNKLTQLSFPRDSVGNLSPKQVRALLEKLKGGKQ